MSCIFFNNLPENPTETQISDALIRIVFNALEEAMRPFENRLTKVLTQGADDVSTEIEKIYTYHSRDLFYLVDDLFADDENYRKKTSYLFSNPERIHLNAEDLMRGFYPMGYVFAFYWLIATDTDANPNICNWLNDWHYARIDKMWKELTAELGCEPPTLKYRPAPT